MRKNLKIITVAVILAVLIVAGIFFALGYFKPLKAGIIVDTNPSSTVFVNNEEVGKSRYEGTFEPGEKTIKLVPDSFEKPLPPYEVKVTLVPGVKTMIQREFGSSEETSSGAIVSFEKTSEKDSSLAVVSTPDAGQLSLDGQVRGFTPYKTPLLSSGEHVLSLTASGFIEKTIKVKTYPGYKLTAIVKLAVDTNKVETSPTPTPQSEEKKYIIEILNTPTGFLRVRSEASTLAKEVGQVEPGKKYNLLGEDEKTGWFKIEYQEGKEGWVSNQYAKKVESTVFPTPEPSPSLNPKATPKVTASVKASPTIKATPTSKP